MNIVLQSPTIRSPFKALWHWLTGAPTPAQFSCMGTRQASTRVVMQAPRAITLRAQVLASQPNVPSVQRFAHRPLRTVRVMEAGLAPGQVGRMVMSGRMADVCAELDRLAACEARLHWSPRLTKSMGQRNAKSVEKSFFRVKLLSRLVKVCI